MPAAARSSLPLAIGTLIGGAVSGALLPLFPVRARPAEPAFAEEPAVAE